MTQEDSITQDDHVVQEDSTMQDEFPVQESPVRRENPEMIHDERSVQDEPPAQEVFLSSPSQESAAGKVDETENPLCTANRMEFYESKFIKNRPQCVEKDRVDDLKGDEEDCNKRNDTPGNRPCVAQKQTQKQYSQCLKQDESPSGRGTHDDEDLLVDESGDSLKVHDSADEDLRSELAESRETESGPEEISWADGSRPTRRCASWLPNMQISSLLPSSVCNVGCVANEWIPDLQLVSLKKLPSYVTNFGNSATAMLPSTFVPNLSRADVAFLKEHLERLGGMPMVLALTATAANGSTRIVSAYTIFPMVAALQAENVCLTTFDVPELIVSYFTKNLFCNAGSLLMVASMGSCLFGGMLVVSLVTGLASQKFVFGSLAMLNFTRALEGKLLGLTSASIGEDNRYNETIEKKELPSSHHFPLLGTILASGILSFTNFTGLVAVSILPSAACATWSMLPDGIWSYWSVLPEDTTSNREFKRVIGDEEDADLLVEEDDAPHNEDRKLAKKASGSKTASGSYSKIGSHVLHDVDEFTFVGKSGGRTKKEEYNLLTEILERFSYKKLTENGQKIVADTIWTLALPFGLFGPYVQSTAFRTTMLTLATPLLVFEGVLFYSSRRMDADRKSRTSSCSASEKESFLGFQTLRFLGAGHVIWFHQLNGGSAMEMLWCSQPMQVLSCRLPLAGMYWVGAYFAISGFVNAMSLQGQRKSESAAENAEVQSKTSDVVDSKVRSETVGKSHLVAGSSASSLNATAIENPENVAFFWRRFRELYPSYFASCCIGVGAIMMGGAAAFPVVDFTKAALLASPLVMPLKYGALNSPLSHMWYISGLAVLWLRLPEWEKGIQDFADLYLDGDAAATGTNTTNSGCFNDDSTSNSGSEYGRFANFDDVSEDGLSNNGNEDPISRNVERNAKRKKSKDEKKQRRANRRALLTLLGYCFAAVGSVGAADYAMRHYGYNLLPWAAANPDSFWALLYYSPITNWPYLAAGIILAKLYSLRKEEEKAEEEKASTNCNTGGNTSSSFALIFLTKFVSDTLDWLSLNFGASLSLLGLMGGAIYMDWSNPMDILFRMTHGAPAFLLISACVYHVAFDQDWLLTRIPVGIFGKEFIHYVGVLAMPIFLLHKPLHTIFWNLINVYSLDKWAGPGGILARMTDLQKVKLVFSPMYWSFVSWSAILMHAVIPTPGKRQVIFSTQKLSISMTSGMPSNPVQRHNSGQSSTLVTVTTDSDQPRFVPASGFTNGESGQEFSFSPQQCLYTGISTISGVISEAFDRTFYVGVMCGDETESDLFIGEDELSVSQMSTDCSDGYSRIETTVHRRVYGRQVSQGTSVNEIVSERQCSYADRRPSQRLSCRPSKESQENLRVLWGAFLNAPAHGM